MTCVAVIALKRPADGKQRLRAVLSEGERAALVLTMFEHVVTAVGSARHVDDIVIVTPAPRHLPFGLRCLQDAGTGLNAALRLATQELSRQGIEELVVFPGDLPLLTGDDVDRLVTAGALSGLALAPDQRLSGTNAIYQRLPQRIEYCFGADSWARHHAATSPAPQVVLSPGLMFDVDLPSDLRAWRGPISTVTAQPGQP